MKYLIIFILLAIALPNVHGQKVQLNHVEPANWWVNMEHSKVEVMLHGENIAKYSVKALGLEIVGIVKTENPNYLFVTIDTKNVAAQEFVFTFKNGNKSFTQNYSLKARRENSKYRKSYDSSDVIYLIMPVQ